MPGQHPLVARRVSYFQSIHFEGLFDPHPNHPPPPTLRELARLKAARAKARDIWLSASAPSGEQQSNDPPPQPGWFSKHKTELLVTAPFLALGAVVLAIILLAAPTQPDTATAQPASQSPTAEPISAFRQGLADRRAWEKWFGGLKDDMHEGAAFWAGERSKLNPGSCYDGSGRIAGDFRQGCLYAKQFLTPTDPRRKTEPEYRRGWNSY
jgi:hypothetical protein